MVDGEPAVATRPQVAPTASSRSDLAAAADQLALALPLLTHMNTAIAALRGLFTGDDPAGEVLFSWCASSVWRRDAQMAPLLKLAIAQAAFRDRVPAVARDRVVEGPLLDALACAPLIGQGEQLGLPANAEARARLEILIWEAGASALEVPALGPWLWGSHSTFDAMIRGPRTARSAVACSRRAASR